MFVEVVPSHFKRSLLSAGLRESDVLEIEMEFPKNNYMIEDEVLLSKLMHFGLDMFSLIAVFSKLGIGEKSVVRMIEKKEREKLGAITDVYTIEVEE